MSPRWISTRSGGARPVRFIEALRSGLAPDGGLYVPERIPPLDAGLLEAPARDVGFASVAERVLEPWLGGEFPNRAWRTAVRSALSFPVPLVHLPTPWSGVHLLELFHGPTLSFKDFGARTMARLLAAAGRERLDEIRHVLVATSGDTGSAVADGFSGLPGFRVILLYPGGQVSAVQERQLAARREGVVPLRVRGTFDACQRLVKEAFSDGRFARLLPSSANSINVGRLLPQMLYYVYARALTGGTPVFCVPSGNLGNLTAGILAELAGLPVSGFIAAHNANDAFVRFLDSGEARFGPSVRTVSNAMDVGAPSNFERLTRLLGPGTLRERIVGETVSDEETLLAMRVVHEETGYIADPHTAVALEAVRRRRRSGSPHVVLASAHPAKFPETVSRALGFTPEEPAPLATLQAESAVVRTIDPTLDALYDGITGRSVSG